MNTSRRSFFRRTLGTVATTAVLQPANVFGQGKTRSAADDQPDECETALQRLLDGNSRFVDEESQHPHVATNWRKRLVGGQKPFATILGCSDSRVPPELLFDQGFGDLFVVRVAGNVIDTDVIGSVEYGVDHLDTRLVVVMGHDGCGAVTAALSAAPDLAKEPNEIQSLVGKIRPSINKVDQQLPFKSKLRQSVEANVRASVAQLANVSDLKNAVETKRTRIVGCVYDIDTGQIRMLDTKVDSKHTKPKQ